MLLLIEFLIIGSRNNVFSAQTDTALPFDLLCFFQDSIDLPKSPQFKSRLQMVSTVAQYITSDLSPACKMQMEAALLGQRIESVDSLVDLFDSLLDLFHNDPQADVNGVCAPTHLCMDSFLGLYVRTCVTRYECMPFDGIGELFEHVQVFRSRTIRSSSPEEEEELEVEEPQDEEQPQELAPPTPFDTCPANAFDRDHNHNASKELLFDLGTSEGIMNTFTINNSITEAHYHGRLQNMDPASFLLNAQKAMLSSDSLVAEDSLHRFFDHSKSLLHASKLSPNSAGRAGGVNNITDEASAQALEALVSSLGEPQYAGTRHQTAMLALSSMWARAGHFQLALRGTEEAMKTAHQRGDHAAVTKALLLFHVILLEEEGGENGAGAASARGNAEEVLQRCLVRCANLGLRALSSQAALQLVRLRTRGYLLLQKVENEIGAAEMGSSSSASSGSVQDLWCLMSAMSLGDIHLTARVATSSSSNQSGASAQIKIVEASGVDAPLNVSEAMHFSAQVAETYMDIWMRLGCAEIAEITGRRALRQLGLHATAEDLVTIGTRIAQMRAETAYEVMQRQQKLQQRGQGVRGLGGPELSNAQAQAQASEQARLEASQQVQNALQIVSALQEAFPAQHPALLSDALHAARLFVSTYRAMIDLEWERALRLALRLSDATGATAQSGLSPAPALFANGSASGAGKGLDVRQAQALLLLARITFQFDKAEAKALLVRVENDAQRAGLVQYVTLARSLRAQLIDLMYSEGKSACDNNNKNDTSGNSTELGSHLESHSEQAWRMDALLLTFNAAKLSKESGSALASLGSSQHVAGGEGVYRTYPSFFDQELVL